MGYPQIGKNRVLVLPVPASDMTAEEYKEAFGIDLNDIELRDLILLQEAGKQAFPVLYIDKENKILYTAERAYSYNDEFALVEGDSLIAKVIETGTIENAKPLYFHPVVIGQSGAQNALQCSVIILNNDDTAFTSWDSIKAYMTSIAVSINAIARFPATGVCRNNDQDVIILSHFDVYTTGQVYVQGTKTDGTLVAGTALNVAPYSIADSNIHDGINKVN